MKHATKEISIQRINGRIESDASDHVAAEEPLEIRIENRSVAVVMRTPGEDRELAAGFLVSEGLVHDAAEIAAIDLDGPDCNVVRVRLSNPASLDLDRLTRHVFTSSSCGICSKATIEAVRQTFPPLVDFAEIDPQVLARLPDKLAAAQNTFRQTGGLHACGLFDLTGELLALREDVGRHNALDKIVGWALLEGRLPLHEHVLLLSGRVSFELMQKALAAGVPIVAAVSAPSSLAVEFAQESGQTLVGFLRGQRMNLYAGAARVQRFGRTSIAAAA